MGLPGGLAMRCTPQTRLLPQADRPLGEEAVTQLRRLLTLTQHEELRIRMHRFEVCQVDPRECHHLSAVDDDVYGDAHPGVRALQHERIEKGKERWCARVLLVGSHSLRKGRRGARALLVGRKGWAQQSLDCMLLEHHGLAPTRRTHTPK